MALFGSFEQLVENTAHLKRIKGHSLLVEELLYVLVEVLKDQEKLVFLESMDNVLQIDNELVVS